MLFLALLLVTTIITTTSKAQSNPSGTFVVAVNDGSVQIDWEIMSKGYNDSKGNFFKLPVNITQAIGNYTFYEIIMGEFRDYLIPAIDFPKSANLSSLVLYPPFQVLVGGIRWGADLNLRPYTYSKFSPLDTLFNGFSRLLINEIGGLSIYGSSPLNYLNEGVRNRLTSWGSDTPGKTGGCCSNSTTDPIYGYGKPYKIIAHVLPLNYLYLHVISVPTAYYIGQKIGVKAVVADVFLRTEGVPEAVTNWEMIRDDTLETIKLTSSKFSKGFLKPINEPKEFSITLKAFLSNPGSKKFWPLNLNISQISFKLQRGLPVFPQGAPIDFNAPITTMLRFANPENSKDVISIQTNVNRSVANETNFFDSDAKIMPKKGENMTAKDKSKASKKYNWNWEPINATNGKFGGNVNLNNSFQYFAFPIYNPVKQVIPVAVTCPNDAFCFLYIDGIFFDGTVPEFNTPSLEFTEFDKGWHQVIVKFVSPKPINSGFQVSFEASGLVFGKDLSINPNTNIAFDNKSKTMKIVFGVFFSLAIMLLLF